MPQPPPFVLPPDGLGSRVRAMLAGAGRQRVAIALLALAALVGGGYVWARANPPLAGATTGQETVAPSDQTLPSAAPDTSATAAPSPDPAVTPGSSGITPSAPLDLNTATPEQLDTLPGVGEVTANRIVTYRSAHPFTTVEELLEVPGIGQRRFEQLKDLVTVT
jgi:competence protein ComEA